MLPHYLQEGGRNPTNKTEKEKEGTGSGAKETEEGTCGGTGQQ
jgi:hypothetical protein